MKLNAAQLAALARGATQAEIAALADAPTTSASASAEAEVAAAAAAGGAATGASTPTAPPAAGAAPDAAVSAGAEHPSAPAAAAAQPSELVTHLTAQLAERDSALLAANVQVETFKAQAAAVDGLVTALRGVIGERLVALGGSAEIAAGYTASNIVAEHARIDGVFKTQFRVGGVAAVASPEDKPNAKVEIDPMLAAAMQSSLVK